MTYKTELHCHTAEASVCATENCADTVEKYIREGYTTVVLTNHYSKHTRFAAEVVNKTDFTEYYLNAYRKMKDYAGERLNVILGAEVTFDNGDPDDYLVYGITEEFLLAHKDILSSNIRDFHDLCTENGFVVVQAHPFRNGMVLRDPWFIDGIEVFNGSDEPNHNDIADMWANYYPQHIKTAGTDHHGAEDQPASALATDVPMTSGQQIADVLRSGNYALIKLPRPDDTRAEGRKKADLCS